MMKFKNYHFNIYFFLLCILLILTTIIFFALFQFKIDEVEIIEENNVKIIKTKKVNSFESVNYFFKKYYQFNFHGDSFVNNKEIFSLRSIKESSSFYVDENIPTIERDNECTHFTCFDLYRCKTYENLIKIYIYPIKNYLIKQNDNHEILNEFSEQFYQVLETIYHSPFYTNKPEEACVFVVPIDTLNDLNYKNKTQISQIFNYLKHFNEENGRNHLFFNFISNETHLPSLDLGKALVAGGGFDTFDFRESFDISIPVYSLLSEKFLAQGDLKEKFNKLIYAKRKWTLLVIQFDLLTTQEQAYFKKLEKNLNLKVLLLTNKCEIENDFDYRCNLNQTHVFNYNQVIEDSTFCLFYRTKYLGNPLLSDILMHGCIPIIAIDDYILPFHEKIDWFRFSIRIHEKYLINLEKILKDIDNQTLIEMRKHALFMWKKFFSTIERITISTLYILNERVYSYTALSKEDWNKLEDSLNIESNFFYNPLNIINTKLNNIYSNTIQQGFTAVILTYNRLESLMNVIRQLVDVPSCTKILIVWNNQEKQPPNKKDFFKQLNSKWTKQIKVPIEIIVTLENKLSNRFFPYEEIETECILAIDDDIVMLTADELEFSFQTWREFQDHIVGFPSRVHKWDKKKKRWKYESEWTNEVSMILTGAAFYHKYYNYLYTFEMPNEIREWVDKNINCEDIAMNFLVANITNKAPIKTTPRKKFKCPQCINKTMLSSDSISHLNKRSECINKFVSIYGKMPLKTVEFRADPVLYKDNLPEKLKKYNQIGNL